MVGQECLNRLHYRLLQYSDCKKLMRAAASRQGGIHLEAGS